MKLAKKNIILCGPHAIIIVENNSLIEESFFISQKNKY